MVDWYVGNWTGSCRNSSTDQSGFVHEYGVETHRGSVSTHTAVNLIKFWNVLEVLDGFHHFQSSLLELKTSRQTSLLHDSLCTHTRTVSDVPLSMMEHSQAAQCHRHQFLGILSTCVMVNEFCPSWSFYTSMHTYAYNMNNSKVED